MLEWQQLYPQCVPISPSKQWETALEQVQQKDQEGLPAAHTKSLAYYVATIDICFMLNFSSHCCLTYLLKIIPCSRVRKLMNLSAGKGHHCNKVPGSCKVTDCIPMFPSHTPFVIFFLLSLWLSSDQGQHFVPYNKMFISQIGLISVKPSLGHH